MTREEGYYWIKACLRDGTIDCWRPGEWHGNLQEWTVLGDHTGAFFSDKSVHHVGPKLIPPEEP